MGALEGRTALVTDGGAPLGRATALALAARGARVIVTGRGEKALGETVGEIAYGGGKARHVVADPHDDAQLRAAAARADEVFGGLDIVVLTDDDPVVAECMHRVVATRAAAPRAIVVVSEEERALEPDDAASRIAERCAAT